MAQPPKYAQPLGTGTLDTVGTVHVAGAVVTGGEVEADDPEPHPARAVIQIRTIRLAPTNLLR